MTRNSRRSVRSAIESLAPEGEKTSLPEGALADVSSEDVEAIIDAAEYHLEYPDEDLPEKIEERLPWDVFDVSPPA